MYRTYILGRACGYFLYVTSIFRTDKDVREIEQQRVCPANSTLNSVHGSTLFNRLFSKAYGESVFKRLTESRFSKTLEAGPPRHHYAKANTQRIIFNKDVGVSSQ